MPSEMGRNEPQEPLQSSVCAADSFVTVDISLPKVDLKSGHGSAISVFRCSQLIYYTVRNIRFNLSVNS